MNLCNFSKINIEEDNKNVSLENIYQAIPENCTLLERARHDAGYEQGLRHLASYASETEAETDTRTDHQSHLVFVIEAKLICNERPDLAEKKGCIWAFGGMQSIIFCLSIEDSVSAIPL